MVRLAGVVGVLVGILVTPADQLCVCVSAISL
jgi:hypothetical protein